MVVEGQICLQTSDVDNGSHADVVCGPLSICQAYAIQQRVLCGHWGTNGPCGEGALWDWQAPGGQQALGL